MNRRHSRRSKKLLTTVAVGCAMFSSVAIASAHRLGNLVWKDINNNGKVDDGERGIAGVRVELRDTAGVLLAVEKTDANGIYNFYGLTGKDYLVSVPTIGPDEKSPQPFENCQSSTGTIGSATGPYEPAPNPNVKIDNDDNGQLSADGSAFVVSAPVQLRPDPVDLQVNETVDFGIFCAAGLGDYVWEDTNKNGQQDAGEKPIGGVDVMLMDGSGAMISSTKTDANGLYMFDYLPPGTYSVKFTTPAGMNPTIVVGDINQEKNSDANPTTGKTEQVTLVEGEFNGRIDAGFTPQLLALGDHVWRDDNDNGVLDGAEVGIADVALSLRDAGGNEIATTKTNSAGRYLFTGLKPGDYTVCVPAGQLAAGGPLAGMRSSSGSGGTAATGLYEPAPSPNNDKDSDDNGTLQGACVIASTVSLAGGTEPTGEAETVGIADTTPDSWKNTTVDFGFYKLPTAVTPPPAPPAPAPKTEVLGAQKPEAARLVITKTGPTSVRAGRIATYLIKVTNPTKTAATGVVVRDILPTGMSVVSGTEKSTLKAIFKSGRVTWTLGTVAPGATRTVRVNVRIGDNVKGKLDNVATVNAANVNGTSRSVAATRVTPIAPKAPKVAG
jgi:uncharacterized repeat protein (TIGR01451 family)